MAGSSSVRNRKMPVSSGQGPSSHISSSNLQDLHAALNRLQQTSPRQIISPPTQPGRASVAICIRLVPTSPSTEVEEDLPETVDEFFSQDWTKQGGVRAEILYIRRSKSKGDRWSSQVAFPGGKKDPEDEDGLFTAKRETWEEIGIDLADKGWLNVGRLDDREITSSMGKRLLMILTPYVFLQTSKTSPELSLDAREISTVHWIPLDLLTPDPAWGQISISLSPRLSPRNLLVRRFIHLFVGSMQFAAICLPDEPTAMAEGWHVPNVSPEVEAGGDAEGAWYPTIAVLTGNTKTERGLRLWGLTLGMTIDLIALMQLPPIETTPVEKKKQSALPYTVPSSFGSALSTDYDVDKVKGGKKAKFHKSGLNAGLVSVLPRFSLPDIDFFVWVFGRRYRSIIRAWDESLDKPLNETSRRVNWSGAALSAFYASVRRALICAIILRVLSTLASIVLLTWYLFRHFNP